jgi:hypothetical protein
MKHAKMVVDSGDESIVISLFCQLIENSEKAQVYKFLDFEHEEELNDVFSLLKSVAIGIYSGYEQAVMELERKEYLNCEYMDLIRDDFTGRAKDFIEKYVASECGDCK